MLDNIRELLRRKPFTAFRIVLTSGGHHDVTDPHLVVVMLTQVFIAEARSNRWHLLGTNQISAVEFAPREA